MTEKNSIENRTLYLVSTPIGNMSDISERAIKVLSEVSFVAAEDTRNTGMLLKRLNISKPLVSYHKFNESEKGNVIIERLLEGESCALVSDAGTPVISDPGHEIVKLCIDNGIKVVSIPGCCAAITALVVSGMDSRRFVFEGFLPVKGKDRTMRLEEIKTEKRTVVLYESPHRIKKTLEDLKNSIEITRRLSICRELTKINEEIIYTNVNDAPSVYKDKEPRGEYVIIIEGSRELSKFIESSPEDMVRGLIDSGMSKMDAVKSVSKELKIDKNTLYSIFNNDK